MAKIIIQNTREHDITLNLVTDKNEIVSTTIPGARQDPEDRTKFDFGEAEVESELIAAARKKSPVVNHYFDEGWLREKKAPASKKASVGDSKPGDTLPAGGAPWNPAK